MHKQAMEMAKHAMADACAKGYDCMSSQDWDDLKDCVETAEKAIKADYYYMIVCDMKEEEEYEKQEEKWLLKELKEKHGMNEEDSKRFYDAWRYKNGHFAPKGRGTRRGYEESYPAMMETYAPEYWRDLDRGNYNRMYYTNPSGERTGYSDGRNNGNQSGNMGGNVRGYSDGYNDGYREGEKNSKGTQSRYDKARRGYSESKERNKGNTQEENSENMKKLEEVLNTVKDDIKEYVPLMSASEKAMAKQKIDGICKMIS